MRGFTLTNIIPGNVHLTPRNAVVKVIESSKYIILQLIKSLYKSL